MGVSNLKCFLHSISPGPIGSHFSLQACCVALSLMPQALRHGDRAQNVRTLANILHVGEPGSLVFVADDV